MTEDTAPIAKVVVERDQHHNMFLDRWKWMVFVNPPRLKNSGRGLSYFNADYQGSAMTQKRAMKKAMKLVPRYVHTEIR